MTSSSGLGIFTRKLTVITYFENSAGLKVGAAVNLQGVTIGTVKSVTVVNQPDRKLTPVRVVMKINDKFASALKKDSKASLTTVGVLGDTVVDINSQFAVGPPLQDGDELKTTRNAEPDRCSQGQPGHHREPERDPGQAERDRRQPAVGQGNIRSVDQQPRPLQQGQQHGRRVAEADEEPEQRDAAPSAS